MRYVYDKVTDRLVERRKGKGPVNMACPTCGIVHDPNFNFGGLVLPVLVAIAERVSTERESGSVH